MKLKVTHKYHSRSEDGRPVTYRKGDSFDGTERELKAFGDRLERVAGKPKAAKKTAAKKPTSEADDGATDSGSGQGDS